MTVITCGRTHLNDSAEAITRALRESEGYRTDGGCGRQYDLDNSIQSIHIYRCVECARWLCKPCILAHFEESKGDAPPTAPRTTAPGPRAVAQGGGANGEEQEVAVPPTDDLAAV